MSASPLTQPFIGQEFDVRQLESALETFNRQAQELIEAMLSLGSTTEEASRALSSLAEVARCIEKEINNEK